MMSGEVAQRLRERAEVWRRYFPPPPQRTVEVSVASMQVAAIECDEAAGEIERLRDEIEHLEALLVEANNAFDEVTGVYAQAMVAGEEWRTYCDDNLKSTG